MYVDPNNNPINKFRKKHEEIAKLNAPDHKEGKEIALLLKDECTMWNIKINEMSRAITELKGSI